MSAVRSLSGAKQTWHGQPNSVESDHPQETSTRFGGEALAIRSLVLRIRRLVSRLMCGAGILSYMTIELALLAASVILGIVHIIIVS
jgi:hypothetical protein